MTATLPDLAGWVSERGLQVLVVSPHLDDGAFSLAETLRDFPVRAHVHTVFTEGDAGSDPAWAHRTGFEDAFAEFAARRREDEVAMGLIDVPYSHAGLSYAQRDTGGEMVEQVRARIGDQPTLVLLPLGAGDVIAGAARLMRRVLRRPFGSPVHPDHVLVRDTLRGAALSDLATFGYYAELPYHWANSRAELTRRATALFDGSFGMAVKQVDAGYKHRIAQAYVSQLEPILGEKPDYQRKLCAADEIVYVPL